MKVGKKNPNIFYQVTSEEKTMKRYLRNGDKLYTANILGEEQRAVTHKGKIYKSCVSKKK